MPGRRSGTSALSLVLVLVYLVYLVYHLIQDPECSFDLP